MTFGTINLSKELLFRSIYDLNFLSRYCSFWEQLVLRGSTFFFFQSKTCSRPFFELVCRFIWREEYRLAIHFLTVLPSFGGSTWGISYFMLRNLFLSCSHPFFQGLYGTGSFWHQLLIKTNYFFRRPFFHIWYF